MRLSSGALLAEPFTETDRRPCRFAASVTKANRTRPAFGVTVSVETIFAAVAPGAPRGRDRARSPASEAFCEAAEGEAKPDGVGRDRYDRCGRAAFTRLAMTVGFGFDESAMVNKQPPARGARPRRLPPLTEAFAIPRTTAHRIRCLAARIVTFCAAVAAVKLS